MQKNSTNKKKDNAVEFANQMINLDKRFYSLIKILEREIEREKQMEKSKKQL